MGSIADVPQHAPPPTPYPQGETPEASQPESEAFGKYQKFAEKVGGIPCLWRKDHLFQGIFAIGSATIGAILGWFLYGGPRVIGLAFAGLVAGTLLSGFVFMILGWLR